MPNITDQEFDNLFRQAANRITPEPQPGDWDVMQRRLEVAERDARARNISLYSMVALLLLYSFIVPDSLKFGDVGRASMIPGIEQIDSPEPQANDVQLSAISKASKSEAATNSIVNASKNATGSEQPVPGSEQTAFASETKSTGAATFKNESLNENSPVIDNNDLLKENSSPIDNRAKGNSPQVNSKNDVDARGTSADAYSANASPGDHNSTVNTGFTAANDSDNSPSAASLSDTSPSGTSPSGASPSGTSPSGTSPSGASPAGTSPSVANGLVVAGPATVAAMQQPRGAGAFPSATEKVVAPGNRNSSAAVFDEESPEAPSTDQLHAEPRQQPAGVLLSPPGKVVAFGLPGHPWFVKLTLSPDFSSIDYGSAGKTGLNFGPMVEYGISPRVSVSAGAIWSKKLYDQQNPEKTYGSGGYAVHANKLTGDCRIIDIPMNVTYYLMPGRKTNLFVTAGVSSYIMLKENYIYTVSRNNYDYEYEENYSHKNNEWFSMLNLSVGVQRQIANKWFIQGEPFLKAPMKGIGEGKVNLVSAGVFVSVKYKINR
jgi:hypothetical protein